VGLERDKDECELNRVDGGMEGRSRVMLNAYLGVIFVFYSWLLLLYSTYFIIFKSEFSNSRNYFRSLPEVE
jgi:hypothetical protein